MDEVLESKEHLSRFFQDPMSELAQPEFVYGAVMAVSFVAACLLLVSIVMLLTKLHQVKVRRRQRDTIDVSRLPIPTLDYVPKTHGMLHVPKTGHDLETAEIISEHVLNIAQPNRKHVSA